MECNVSVVLGTYNRIEFLKMTIESIREETKKIQSEIIVIDGGSTDGTIDWLTKQRDIILILQHNRGEWNGLPIEKKSWGYFMNLGFKCASGKYICMLSDDCLIVPNSIINGYNFFEEKLNKSEKIGAVAFYWREWPINQDYWVGLTLGNNMYVNHGLYLKSAMEEVGYVDEDAYRFYSADGDVCLKMLQKGYECIPCEDAYIEHYSHANLLVRQENEKCKNDDWESYLHKWRSVYYFEDINDYGGWIRKNYCDKYYTIKKFYPFKEKSKEKKLLKKNFIKNLIDQIDDDKKIVVYGAGIHTQKLLQSTNLSLKNIIYFLDSKKVGELFNNIKICNIDTLLDEKPDVIIISSFTFQEDIFKELTKKLSYDCRIIKLYDNDDVEPYYT